MMQVAGDDGIQKFRPVIKQKLLALAPDIVLADFFDSINIYCVDELGIPAIMHLPVPFYVSTMVTNYLIPSRQHDNMSVCCGVICIK